MRRRAVLLLVLLAGCSSGGRSQSTADPAAAPPPTFTERCHTGQLQARVESATATITVFSLTDRADVACVLEGYVRLDLVGPTGATLRAPTRLTDVPTKRMTLKPGGAASFELHGRATSPDGAVCVPVTPAGVRITPPDETDALTVEVAGASGITGCDGQYGITAMHAAP